MPLEIEVLRRKANDYNPRLGDVVSIGKTELAVFMADGWGEAFSLATFQVIKPDPAAATFVGRISKIVIDPEG